MREKCLASIAIFLLLSSFAATLATMIFVQPAQSQEATVFITPAQNVLEIGQEFTIHINVSYIILLRWWDISLRFDPSVLYTDKNKVQQGPFLLQAGPTHFSVDVASSVVAMTCFIQSINTVDGGGELVSITFNVVGNGKTDLHMFDVAFKDQNGDPTIWQPVPVDATFNTTYPKAYFYYLPSTKGAPDYIAPAYLLRNPVLGDVLTFNASAYNTEYFYLGSYDPDGTITTYSWNFGDDNTTIGDYVTITHSYQAAGSYPVVLTITDNDLKTSTYDDTVVIWKRDVAISDIQVSPISVSPGEAVSIKVNITNTGTKSGTEYVNVTLYSNSDLVLYNSTRHLSAWCNLYEIDPVLQTAPYQFVQGQSIVINYTWTTGGLPFGNYTIWANISLVDPSGTQLLKDLYLKELDFNIANNNLTCSNEVQIKELPNIAVTDIKLTPTLQIPTAISYGATETTVKVTVKNTGDYDHQHFYVVLYGNSTLIMNWTDVSLLAKEEIILEYTWNPSLLPRCNFTLTAQASNVTMEVENGRTGDNKLSLGIIITSLPLASFTYSPAKPLKGSGVEFNATASQAAPGWTIAQYVWRVNGTIDQTLTTATPERGFSNRAAYNVTLTVIDSAGIRSSTYQFINVVILPTSQFAYAPTAPKAGQAVTFDASSSLADKETAPGVDSIVAYRWDFGDGAKLIYIGTNLTTTATHTFAKSGNFSVTLTVTDNEGLDATTTRFVLISKITASISLSLNTQTIEVGENVTITGQITPQRAGVKVSILYKLEIGSWTLLKNVTCDQSGNYQDVWVINTVGNYTIKTMIEGDDKYTNADSQEMTIRVQEAQPLPAPFDPTYYVVGAVIIIVAIGLGYYLLVKRRK